MALKPLDQLTPAYRRRIERAMAAGKTRTQARGHKAGESQTRKDKTLQAQHYGYKSRKAQYDVQRRLKREGIAVQDTDYAQDAAIAMRNAGLQNEIPTLFDFDRTDSNAWKAIYGSP